MELCQALKRLSDAEHAALVFWNVGVLEYWSNGPMNFSGIFISSLTHCFTIPVFQYSSGYLSFVLGSPNRIQVFRIS
jgi:hypothetical protein